MADDPLAQAVARIGYILDTLGSHGPVILRDESNTAADLRLILAALHAVREDAARLDWLEGELEREQSWPSTIPIHNVSLFRRNNPITREAIDAARAANQEGA